MLTIGHSYVVSLNRRLASEIAICSKDKWDVTVVAPSFFHGELGPIQLHRETNETAHVHCLKAYLTSYPQLMHYDRKIRNILSSQWDIVHCWEEPYITVGAQIARHCNRQKLLYYTYQNIVKNYPPPFNWFENYSLSRAVAWISGGQTVSDALGNKRAYKNKPSCQIPLGVDINVFHPNNQFREEIRTQLGWQDNKSIVIGFLGRFVESKGINILQRSLERLELPWRALFVGGGKLKKDIEVWGSKYSDNRVRVVTDVPHKAVPKYLNAMDILAAPSQTTHRWKEQLGRMLIEAMACGVPVIGSDSGEIPFVIQDAGSILPEADSHSWTKEFARLIDSPSSLSEIREKGLHRSRSVYAWPVIARQHIDFFEQIESNVPP